LIRPTIQKIWPAADIPLAEYELAFSTDGELLRITYEADHDLPPDAVSVFQSVLRAELNSPALSVDLRRQRPSGATPPGKGRRAP
jgi:hypothetical protein